LGWPCVIWSAGLATGMFSAKALPEARWQLVQWQA